MRAVAPIWNPVTARRSGTDQRLGRLVQLGHRQPQHADVDHWNGGGELLAVGQQLPMIGNLGQSHVERMPIGTSRWVGASSVVRHLPPCTTG